MHSPFMIPVAPVLPASIWSCSAEGLKVPSSEALVFCNRLRPSENRPYHHCDMPT